MNDAEQYVGEWQPWFAWYPVRLDRRLVWLKRVERRHVTDRYWDMDSYGMPYDVYYWEYRRLT